MVQENDVLQSFAGVLKRCNTVVFFFLLFLRVKMEDNHDEYPSDESEGRPFTIPQVQPLYSIRRMRNRNSYQRKPLKPLKSIVMLENDIAEENSQSMSLQRSEIPQDDSLSGELPLYDRQSHETTTKVYNGTNSNGKFEIFENSKEKLDTVTPLQLRLRTPFSSKSSMSLVKRVPTSCVSDHKKTEVRGMHYSRNSKPAPSTDQLLKENCEKQDGPFSSENNRSKGERVMRDILNFDHTRINQCNSLPKKSFEAIKVTQDSNLGIYDVKGSYNRPVAYHEEFNIHNGLKKTPNAVNKTPCGYEINKNSSSDLQHIDENPERFKKEQSLFRTKECEKSKESRAHNERSRNGMDPAVLSVNNLSYSVLSKLGQGGSSIVYQVLDERMSSVFAVKCVNLIDADTVTANGYLKEIEMLSKLQSSSRVIKLIDHEYLKSQQILYIVMEKGDTDLSTLLKENAKTGEVSFPMIVYYWTEMLHAVKEIHDNGIVHADLKPANFLLVRGRLKLIDFGIASAVQNDATSVFKNSMHGTCNYMSPEAIEDPGDSSRTKVGYKSDVWSLGCILYNLLYRKTPFQHITNNLKKLREISNSNHKIEFPSINKCPVPIMEAVKHCLTYDYKKRPTIAELLSVDYMSGVGMSQQRNNTESYA